MSEPTIAVVLPPRERFRPRDAGAVAMIVRDFTLASRYRDRIVVVGTETEPFADVAFCSVQAQGAWLLGQNLAYARQVIAWLKARPSVRLVEVHNRTALARQIKRALPGLKVTLHLHNDPQGMKGAKTSSERTALLRQLDGLYAVSGYVRRRLLEGVTGPGCPVTVIHNALPRRPRADGLSRQPWLVFAGRFIPEKGVLELAEALVRVLPEFPAWRAVFLGAAGFGQQAGGSPYEQKVYATLAQVADRIDLRGHVPQEEVMRVLAQAAISLTPSTGIDAFPRVPLESMQQGCAVIVSAMGGLPEIAGDAAVVVDPVTGDTLAAALRSLMAEPAALQRLAAACTARAEHFRVETLVQGLDAARDSLLEISR